MVYRCPNLLVPILVAAGLAAGEALPANVVAQPSTIPGNWELTPQPLPPLGEILKRPAGKLPVYGLYIWCGEYRTHRSSIKKVGWKSMRVGGPMDDQTMRMLVEDGMEVMQTLGLRVHGEGRNRANYDSDEVFIADYIKGVESFLARYGPGGSFFKDNPALPERPVRHVEIWNEPNFQYMIPPDDRPRREVEAEREALYAKLLPATYRAIKAKWPGVSVVGFGAGGASAGDIRFIQHVHENSAEVANSYDILSTHPYVNPVPPEVRSVRSWGGYSSASSLATIRRILTAHGTPDRPTWYTEVGWAVSQQDGGYFAMAPGRTTTPMLQAAYVCRIYALAMRLGVERVHIMFATDTDNYNAGFFLRDGSWRPSAHAVQTMLRKLPNPKLVDATSGVPDGFYAYQFEPDAAEGEKRRLPASVIMAWNVAGPKAVEITCRPGKVVVTDMLGHSTEHTAAGGTLSLQVGPCPIYIEVPH